MKFDGRQSFVPLRVLFVDDNTFVRSSPRVLCVPQCAPHCVCRCEGTWNVSREIEGTGPRSQHYNRICVLNISAPGTITSRAATANRV